MKAQNLLTSIQSEQILFCQSVFEMGSCQWIFALILAILGHHSLAEVDRYHRLAKTVLPILYNLSISLEYPKRDQKMNKGRVVIDANVTDETEIIALHKHSTIQIENTEVLSHGVPLEITSKAIDETRELLELTLLSKLEPGPIQIVIDYQWQLGRQSCDFPSGGYENDDYYLITQMQPYGARQLLPCFDEPEFKAKFAVSVNLINFTKDQIVLANMPMKYTDSTTWTFELSPLFSTYLLALAIPKSVHEASKAQAKVGNYNVTVWNYNQTSWSAQELASIVAKAFQSMEKRTGIAYPVTKVDYAFQGVGFAMENWGLITGIIDDVTAVHEAVHGWFGNLVTCAWWDDVWLNEGMTTYYTDLTLLDIQAWTRQNVRDDINARRYKWLKENWMFALHDETFVEDEWATNVYARGPAVLQMFHKAMGEKFETRLFDYLKSNLYKNVNSTTFINALTKNNESVEREMFNSFIFQYDAPLISIIYDNDTKAFIISQKPIHSSRNTKWTIPIWYQRTETETNSEEMRWLRAADEKLMIPMIEDPENYRFDQECIGFAEYIIEIGQDIALHCSSAAEWSEIDFDM